MVSASLEIFLGIIKFGEVAIKGFIVSHDALRTGCMTKYIFKYVFGRIRRLRNTGYGDITHKTYRVHDRDA